MNYGQVGYDPIPSGWNAVVYSCIMLYAKTIAQLPGLHNMSKDDGGTETISTSALSRILKMPNDYQTRSDFMMNMVVSLLSEGNAYAIALRNERFEVASLHQFLSRSCRALVGPTGEIFYSVGGNSVMDYRMDPDFESGKRWIIPQRDVLHIKGPAPRDPLVGESPLVAAGLPTAANTGGLTHFWRFFQNMSRPSGVLSTKATLTKAQVDELRARWEEVTTGINIGKVPILTHDLQWTPMHMNSADMQIAEALKMSKADIAMIFGVPLALINDMTGATWNNTENLIMMWLRQGLGFYLEHIELAFDKLFRIELTKEYTEFQVDTLLRSDFKTRIEGLTKAVQGGVYAPNEARRREGLASVDHGDDPRVQQQLVPLSYGAELQPPAPGAASPPAPPASEEGTEEEEEVAAEEAARSLDLMLGGAINRGMQ